MCQKLKEDNLVLSADIFTLGEAAVFCSDAFSSNLNIKRESTHPTYPEEPNASKKSCHLTENAI